MGVFYTARTIIGYRSKVDESNKEWWAFEDFMGEAKLPLTYERDPYDGNTFWIGWGGRGCEKGEYERLNPPSFDDIKAFIQETVRPWIDSELLTLREEDFGVWTTMLGW